jgi:hypothetical protein
MHCKFMLRPHSGPVKRKVLPGGMSVYDVPLMRHIQRTSKRPSVAMDAS